MVRIEHPPDHGLAHPKTPRQLAIVHPALDHRQIQRQLACDPQRDRNHPLAALRPRWRRNLGPLRNAKRDGAPKTVDGFFDRFPHVAPVRMSFRKIRKTDENTASRDTPKRCGIRERMHILRLSLLYL